MRPRLLAAAVAAALVPAAGLAQNALNPAPVNPSTAGRWMDEEGLGTRIPAARTPTGLLYNVPLDPGPDEEDVRRDAWRWATFIEAGYLGSSGDDRAQLYRYYKDIRQGFLVNQAAVAGERPDTAQYVEATAAGAGRKDQAWRFQAGRYNDWRISASYDGTPVAYTTTYRSLWEGVGTGDLTLASARPGGSANASAAATQAALRATVAGTDFSDLETVRRKAAVRLDKTLTDTWKAFASFSSERKEGARPLGAVFGGGGGGGNVEIAEPIDYLTQDLAAGVQFSDAASSFNLRASASFFRNDIDTLTFQNPLTITTNGSTGLSPTTFTQGRFDLPPDNEHYNVRAEYARSLPDLWRAHFTATAALGSMRQDDDLIAPTTLPLTGGTVTAGGAPLANHWNTTGALSRSSARTRLDTRLLDLSLAAKPASVLDVKGKVRVYETDNAATYLSCNPLTGQWGRILNDGSGLSLAPGSFNAAACNLDNARALGLVPATGNVPIAAAPADYRQVNASLAADWQVARMTSVNAALEREAFHREFRERDETREDRLRLALVERGAIEGLVRLSWEHSRRTGSDYHPNPYEAFYSASLGPYPTANGVATQSWLHSIAQFRSFDLADRDQDVVNGRVNYAFHPTVDGAMTLQWKDADYPAAYGRSGRQRAKSVTLDLTWQAGAAGELYGFYAYQDATGNQRGIAPAQCVIGTAGVTAANWQDLCGTASPTSPLFPESRAWDVDSRDRNDVIGVGFRYDFGAAKLDATFSRTLGRTRLGYRYDAAALGLSPTQASLAGDGLSDMTFAQNAASASLLVPIDKTFSMRFLLRYESGRVRDWHYDGLAANPMPANNTLYLDAGPQDYRAIAVGAFLQVRL